MFQIVFQTLFLFIVLWMTLFHDRWENVRDFMTRTYNFESVIYLSGFVVISALMVTIFGKGLDAIIKLFWRIVLKPQKVRNLILCLLFNRKKCQNSQNLRKHFWNICQKYWELSEYHYTLLPTSEHFLIRKRIPEKHFIMAISILTTHLISSIPAWPKFCHYENFMI